MQLTDPAKFGTPDREIKPTPDLRLNKPPNQTVRSIDSLRVRRQGRETVHLPPSTANAINAFSWRGS